MFNHKNLAVAAGAVLLGALASTANAQISGYLSDVPTKAITVNSFGECWQTARTDKKMVDEKGCPKKAPPKAAAPKPTPPPACGKIVIDSKVLFGFDKSGLSNDGKAALDAAAGKLTDGKCAAKSVTVTGHTDSVGSDSYNQKLSEKRATTVKAYLEGKGVKNVSAVGKGESAPVADNKTKDGRAKNRRVEIDAAN